MAHPSARSLAFWLRHNNGKTAEYMIGMRKPEAGAAETMVLDPWRE